MSRSANDDRKRWLDQFLDGLVDGGQREAFERELANDSTLGAEVAIQGRIDSGLRRVYTVPECLPRFSDTDGRTPRSNGRVTGLVRATGASRRFMVWPPSSR